MMNGDGPRDEEDVQTPRRPDLLPARIDALEQKQDTTIDDIRSLTVDVGIVRGAVAGTRAELRALTAMLIARFDALDETNRAHGERIARVEGGSAVLARMAKSHREVLVAQQKRSDPPPRAPLKSYSEVTGVHELEEIAKAAASTQLDGRELERHRKRWERLVAAGVSVLVAVLIALIVTLLKLKR